MGKSYLKVSKKDHALLCKHILKVGNKDTRETPLGVVLLLLLLSVTKRTKRNVSDVVLRSLLLTMNIFHVSSGSIIDFGQVNVCWRVH